MKQLVSVILMCIGLQYGEAQTSICISTDKTISLVFPFAIKHVDRGTKDILVQPVKEADNILLVKAAAKNFSGTNLSIVTGDGSLYSFSVQYGEPQNWIYYLPVDQSVPVSTYANGILDNRPTTKGIKDNKWEIQFRVGGIYIKNNVIYYQLQLGNESAIDYDIDLIRFYIKDRKRAKRTANQELDLKPLYIAGNLKRINAYSQSAIVVALDKFTIPDQKDFRIQLMEKNGGRHLHVKVRNRKIVKAIILPDLK